MDNITCRIILTDQNDIISDRAISGFVEITTSKEVLIEQMFIEMYGVASCEWTLEKPLVKIPFVYKKGTIFSGKEKFYISRHKLIEVGESNVCQGSKRYAFRCGFSPNMPSTWSGEFGNITYAGKVVVIMPKNTTFVYVQDIIIHPYKDLKLEEQLLFEARKEVSRTFHFAALYLGNVKISLWLPICGIAAGQSLPVLCSITNKSKILFGGLIVVLTKTEVYRSQKPFPKLKTVRTDVCRVARVVDVLKGRFDYYCVLDTAKNMVPTNQFWQCGCCRVTYEVWVTLQAALPRHGPYNYPNIDMPGVPVIIGTEPLLHWNKDEITADVMQAVFASHPPVVMEPPPPDDEVEAMLTHVEEALDEETILNLYRQMKHGSDSAVDYQGHANQ